MENMDDDNDDKDDTKRKSRNLSEKKRRDQFNMLLNELGSMINTNPRRMDKSTVLKSTILFLKNHNEIKDRSKVHEIQDDWKPSFLSNEEFTHLILEALDGFIIVFSSNGQIHYTSESVTSLLGYLPSELANRTIYEITYEEDQSNLYNVLLKPSNLSDSNCGKEDNQISFTCHIKRGGLDLQEQTTYECVYFVGYFRQNADIETLIPSNRSNSNIQNDTKMIFVGTGRLHKPQLIRDLSLIDGTKSEFTSRYSLEWKFLFLDHRAPPIIGYLPFEVLGTSGYDYYHVDDLDKIVACHETVMQKGEGISCHYRFLTKGQQWIWLQTKFYIDYNQWNSKPEFIVCTHSVVSYSEVLKQLRNNKIQENLLITNNQEDNLECDVQLQQQPQQSQQSQQSQQPQQPQQSIIEDKSSMIWSTKSTKTTKSIIHGTRSMHHGGGESMTSMSPGSQCSKQSISTTHSLKPTITKTSSNKIRRIATENSTNCLIQKKQIDNEQICSNYNIKKQQCFSTESSTISSNEFMTRATPSIPMNIQNSMIVNEQNVNITNTQNQIQDELQRKHEELQQLIVHQQEELRRVSEQLLIARYGILSPIVNVNLPHNINPCLSTNCGDNVNVETLIVQQKEQELECSNLQNPHPVPLIPVETFHHTTALIPISTTVLSPIIDVDNTKLHSSDSFTTLHQHQSLEQHQQLNSQNQHQLPHVQPLNPQVNQHSRQMMSFRICPQTPMHYSNVITSDNGQHQSPGN